MRTLSTFLIATTLSLILSFFANAASSDWQNLGGGKARLLAVKDPVTSKIEGVIEIQLEKGWKTYWRSPGDAGIPPTFDFSASNFIELRNVDFPTPEVVNIPDTYFMGYKGNVRFVFEADSFSHNASLNLDMLAGVCEEICIPATANFQISAEQLNVSDPLASSILAMAKLNLPPIDSAKINIQKAELENTKLLITTKLANDVDQAILLLEGPQGWFSGPIQITGDMFTVDLGEDFVSNEDWRKNYRYTILIGDTAISDELSSVK